MSSPEVNPFKEADSCSACPTGQSVYSAVLNDETSCQPNICTCPNGTPTLSSGSGGTLCDTATVDCSGCNVGYKLSSAAASGSAQKCLFETQEEQVRDKQMMTVLDAINTSMGKGTLHFASTGFTKVMSMRQLQKSPQYTTHWDELPTCVCGLQ